MRYAKRCGCPACCSGVMYANSSRVTTQAMCVQGDAVWSNAQRLVAMKFGDTYSLPLYTDKWWCPWCVPYLFGLFDLKLQDLLAKGSSVAPRLLEGPAPSAPTLHRARRRSFETHAAITKQRDETARSWTPCATISATRWTRCAPRQSKQMSLSPLNNKAVGSTGFAESAGPPPPTKTSYDTVGAAPRCSTAASTVPESTGRSTSSCARPYASNAPRRSRITKRGEVE